MKRKYGMGTGHSHSSLIDFSLSGGIPGLLLWLLFFGSLIRLGWRAYFHNNDVVGMALIMLVVGTLLRMIVDSNLRDHGLEQFLFLAAVLASLAANGIQQNLKKPAFSE
jgi:O-antigen ligase